jgi:hypothetical protein
MHAHLATRSRGFLRSFIQAAVYQPVSPELAFEHAPKGQDVMQISPEIDQHALSPRPAGNRDLYLIRVAGGQRHLNAFAVPVTQRGRQQRNETFRVPFKDDVAAARSQPADSCLQKFDHWGGPSLDLQA